MKIETVELVALSQLHTRETTWFTDNFRVLKADATIVRVRTDEGVEGIGEGSPHGQAALMARWLAYVAPAVIGRDPLDEGLAFFPNGVSDDYDCAVAGLDMALWDLRGKLVGRKLAELISGDARTSVELYASGGCRYDWRDRPESVIEEVLGYQASGYRACKIRMGTRWGFDGVTPERFLGLMRDLRSAVGEGLVLMVDAGCRLSRDEARIVARGLDELGFFWLEEPLERGDVEGYAELNRDVGMHITGGEAFTTLQQLEPFLRSGGLGIVQPDTGSTGVTQFLRIARIAEEAGVLVCPHCWHNGVMVAANAHLLAALATPMYLELGMHHGPIQWGIVSEPPEVRDGVLTLPRRPGVGVGFDNEAAGRFSPVEGWHAVPVYR